MRSTLAHIRQSRIAPSAIDAPPPSFTPQPAGVGTPVPTAAPEDGAAKDDADEEDPLMKRGLQEERVNRDAWRGILDALTRLKASRDNAGTVQMETED